MDSTSVDCAKLTGPGQPSCARGFAQSTGFAVASALHCGATPMRVAPLADAVHRIVVQLARSGDEERQAFEDYNKARDAELLRLRASVTQDCTRVPSLTEAVERRLGMRSPKVEQASPVQQHADLWASSPPPHPLRLIPPIDCAALHRAGHKSCALGFVRAMGGGVGAAVYCGASEERIVPLSSAVLKIGASLARDAREKEALQDAFTAAAKRGMDELQAVPAPNCAAVPSAIETMERRFGMR